MKRSGSGGGPGEGGAVRSCGERERKEKERKLFPWPELPLFLPGNKKTLCIVFLAPCGDKALWKTMQEALSIIIYLFCFHAKLKRDKANTVIRH